MFRLALTAFESALNRVLQLDPDLLHQLAPLSGKVVQLSITDWNIELFLLPSAAGVQLLATYTGEVDTCIRGKLFGLVRVGLAGATGAALFENEIEITGDVHTGTIIRDVLRNLDIDWEAHLAKLTGDSFAHGIGSVVKKTVSGSKKGIAALQENLTEYLQQEAQLLPTATQLDQFYQDIHQLRNDVARLEARIIRLQKEA